MKSFGLDVALDSISMYQKFGIDKINLAVMDQESIYMTHDELKDEGFHAITSANYNGLESYQGKWLNYAKWVLIIQFLGQRSKVKLYQKCIKLKMALKMCLLNFITWLESFWFNYIQFGSKVKNVKIFQNRSNYIVGYFYLTFYDLTIA